MVTIALRSSGGALEHLHVKEDLTSQADGYNTVFVTTFEYKPGTVVIYQAGLAMLDGYNNDFIETGSNQITWVNDIIGPPEADTPIWAHYQRKLP